MSLKDRVLFSEYLNVIILLSSFDTLMVWLKTTICYFSKKKKKRTRGAFSNTEFKVFLSTFRGPVPSNSITQQVVACDTDQSNAENFYNENKRALQKLTDTEGEIRIHVWAPLESQQWEKTSTNVEKVVDVVT